jgi:hypothetical protein
MHFKPSLCVLALAWATTAIPQADSVSSNPSSSPSISIISVTSSFSITSDTSSSASSSTIAPPAPTSGTSVFVQSDSVYLEHTATIVSAGSGTTTFSIGGIATSTYGQIISITPVITQGPSSYAIYASYYAATAGITISVAINQICSIETNSQSSVYLASCSFNQYSVGGNNLPAEITAELAEATRLLNSELATTTIALATVTATTPPTSNAAPLSTHQSIPVVGLLSAVIGAFALGCLIL